LKTGDRKAFVYPGSICTHEIQTARATWQKGMHHARFEKNASWFFIEPPPSINYLLWQGKLCWVWSRRWIGYNFKALN
jgi:hypothetical protein